MHNTFSYPKRKRQSEWLNAIVAGGSLQNGGEVRRVTVRPGRSNSIESIDLEGNQGRDVERVGVANQVREGWGHVSVEIPDADYEIQVVGSGAERDSGDGVVIINGARVAWHSRGVNGRDGRKSERVERKSGCWVYIRASLSGILDLCRQKCANWATTIVEGGENDQHGPSICLVRDYDMKYCVGACPYRLQTETTESEESWFWWAVGAVNKTAFWSINAFSVFQSVCFAKGQFLKIVSGEAKYFTYAGFATNCAWIIAKCCAIYIHSSKEEMTKRLLKAMQEYEKKYHSQLSRRLNWGRWSRLVNVNAILAIVFGVMRAYYATDPDDAKDLILSSSYELSKTAFKWSNQNGNATDALLKTEYGTNLTPTTVAMGIIVILRDAASNIHVGSLLNSIVTLGIVLNVYVYSFMKEVNELTPNVPADDVETWNAHQARREEAWERFESLANVMDGSNDIYETEFKFLHVTYLMAVAFFITLVVYSDLSYISLSLFAVVLLTMMVWYFLAGRIAVQNDAIQKWIHNWADGSTTIRINGVDKNVNVILHKLDKNPIGFGRGNFVISDTFHYKVMALVVSVFFSIAAELND